ncbi:MAG: hypothetical protein ACREDY_08215, partial [Bradyrhizobium sp.]
SSSSPAAPYRAAINLFLVLVVLWSTYMLMWDCTHIDNDGDPSAMGLLEAAGLEEGPPEDTEKRDQEEAKDPPGVWGLINRYQRYRAKKKRRRILGVWVVYFALGTLPIFGLGQALVDPDDVVRRRVVFWLMSLYAGSALGLLMTTCFLTLRRYLRQRGVTMPAAMTSVWLTSGAVLVLILLVVGALLPRPKAEYRLIDVTPLGKDEREASKFSPKKDSAGKGEGQPGDKPGDTEKGKGTNGKDKPKDAGDKGGKGSKGKDGDTKGGDTKDKGDKGGRDEKDKGGERKERNESDAASESSPPATGLQEVMQQISKLLKWIAFAVVGLIVVFALLKGGLRY